MGNFLSDALGTSSQYEATANQAGNPYDPETLRRAQENQAALLGQQQQLGGMLQQQAAGKGPNPAQTQFMQNVAQNQANTQGLIASQRGLNPALAARMGANANAASNAQAAGQAAILQQNQQIAAQQQLGGLYGQMQQGNLGQQGLYVQGQGNAMAANVATAQGNQKAAQGIVGGIFGGAGAAMGLARGGMVPKMAAGGDVSVQMPPMEIEGQGSLWNKSLEAPPIDFSNPIAPQQNDPMQPRSALAQILKRPTFGPQDPMQQGLTTFGAGLGDQLRGARAGGADRTTPSDNLFPGFAMGKAKGGAIQSFKPGGKVAGKPKYKGDDYRNDTVDARLSPGEVVIPNHITQKPMKEAVQDGAKFLAAVLAKKGRKS